MSSGNQFSSWISIILSLDFFIVHRWVLTYMPVYRLHIFKQNISFKHFDTKFYLALLLVTHVYVNSCVLTVRAATRGKAAKAWSLGGFSEIENGGGGRSGGAPVKWPPLWRPWLPNIYRGGPGHVILDSTFLRQRFALKFNNLCLTLWSEWSNRVQKIHKMVCNF